MRVPVEIRRNPDQSIDEICIDGGNVHIEQMDDSGWFMGVEAKDGSYWQFWFGAKNRKSHVEFRHTEMVPAEEERRRRSQVTNGREEPMVPDEEPKKDGWRCPKCGHHYFDHAIRQGRPVCPVVTATTVTLLTDNRIRNGDRDNG